MRPGASATAQAMAGDQQKGAEAADHVGPADGGRATAAEPLVQHRHQGYPAAKALSHCHKDVGHVEHPEVFDAGEEDPSPAQEHEADEDHAPGTNSVDQVPFEGADETALDAGEGEGQAQLGAGPAEMQLQGHCPHGHGVEEGDGRYDHDKAGDDDQPPAVENPASPPGVGCPLGHHVEQT